MTPDPSRIPRMLAKLQTLWAANPDMRLGQLLETIEDTGWDMLSQRACAPRLMWMGDDLFEAALDARQSQ